MLPLGGDEGRRGRVCRANGPGTRRRSTEMKSKPPLPGRNVLRPDVTRFIMQGTLTARRRPHASRTPQVSKAPSPNQISDNAVTLQSHHILCQLPLRFHSKERTDLRKILLEEISLYEPHSFPTLPIPEGAVAIDAALQRPAVVCSVRHRC